MNLRNTVILVGRIATEPKIININPKLKVLAFKLAVDNFYKSNKTNKVEKDTQFIPLMIFGESRIQRAIGKINVGDSININGSIWYETFKDQKGVYKNYFNVIIDKWLVLRKKASNDELIKTENTSAYEETKDLETSNISKIEDSNVDDFFTLPDDFMF